MAIPYKPMSAGLRLTEGAASNMRSAATGINTQIGTFLLWFVPTSVANANRAIAGKGGGTNGVTWNRRTADGTAVEFIATRTTTPQSVISATGLLAAGQAICLGGQFDIAGGNPTLYAGTLGGPLNDISTSPSNGSGTHTNTTGDYRCGASGANASGGIYYAFAVSLYRLTLDEMRVWQFNPSPNIRGCDCFWRLGMQGGLIAYDEAEGYRGVATSAVVAPDALPIVRPKPPKVFPPFTKRFKVAC